MVGAFLVLLSPVTGFAQQQDDPGVFSSYQALRAELDPLIENREIGALMERFGALGQTTRQNLMALERQVQDSYLAPLDRNGLFTIQEFEPGFRQEILYYWDGGRGYLFVRLILHELEDGQVNVIRFSWNNSVDVLLQSF